jgi:hypothetical protein
MSVRDVKNLSKSVIELKEGGQQSNVAKRYMYDDLIKIFT